MSLTDAERRMLGASDAGALLGLSRYSGQVALWARMAHGVDNGIGLVGEEGLLAEAYNRSLYRNRTGYALLGPSKWAHPLHPWLRCSPDDRAQAPEGRRLVELKRAQSLEGWGAEGTDAVPVEYWLQVQVQIGVGLDLGEVEAEAGDVSALLRGELRLYSVGHQPEVYGRFLEVAGRFVRDFVEPKRFPEGPRLTLLERDAEALAALYPRPTQGEPLKWESLTPAQQQQVGTWLKANAARKAWEKQEKAAALHVKALLREAPGLVLPEGRVDFEATKDAEETDWRAVAEELEQRHGESPSEWRALLTKHTTKHCTRPLVARGMT